MPKLRAVSGETVIKILCNRFGFSITGRAGSHVRLSKFSAQGKIGTVVPAHDELKIGTLMGILKMAKIDPEEFAEFL